jgi:hypothetical protein
MPTLDVNDAFDPSFIDTFTVLRRVQVLNQYGRIDIQIQQFEADGVVVPTSPNDLQRLPDLQYMNKSISIYTQCLLQGPTPGHQPDEILWHGSQFIVRSLDDYSGYGRGFLMVICVSVDVVDPAPPMLYPMGTA